MIDRLWQGFEADWASRLAHRPRTGSGMIDALSRVRMQ